MNQSKVSIFTMKRDSMDRRPSDKIRPSLLPKGELAKIRQALGLEQ